MRFFKLLIFFENFYGARYLLSCHLPSKSTFAQLLLVLRGALHHRQEHGFQYSFRQITATFSAGRGQQGVFSDMLLHWCSQFKKKNCFHFSRDLSSVVDYVNREFTKPRRRRQRKSRLKNEFIFYLRISRYDKVIYFVYH